MALKSSTQRPLRLRTDDSDSHEESAPSNASGQSEDESDNHSAASSEAGTSQSESEPEIQDEPSLADISFGALAKAQEGLAPRSRKRKQPGDSEFIADTSLKSQTTQVPERLSSSKSKTTNTTRTSKHAPTINSSRYEVSRRREVFSPPASIKSRDPRFDPTVNSSTPSHHSSRMVEQEKANKNYSFLNEYQAAEVLSLKNQIKSSKDPEAVSRLKREVMSIESKLRNAERQQREKDIQRKHTQAEKEKIRTGQKSRPYYLKDSEVKKLANEERLEGMGKKAREKALERKRKREKSKESKFMPKVRREK